MYYLIFLSELIFLFVISQVLTRSLSQIFYTVTRSMKVTVFLLALLFFPGTLIHELAHYFMAAFMQVPVGDIKLFPEIHEDGVKLGSVNIAETDIFRRSLIGVAPFLVGMSILLMLFFSFLKSINVLPVWALILGIYIIFEIANTMFSSKKDLEGVVELGATLVIVSLVLFFAGVRPPTGVINFFTSSQTIYRVQQGMLYMAIPLGIDLVTIGIMMLLLRVVRPRYHRH